MPHSVSHPARAAKNGVHTNIEAPRSLNFEVTLFYLPDAMPLTVRGQCSVLESQWRLDQHRTWVRYDHVLLASDKINQITDILQYSKRQGN